MTREYREYAKSRIEYLLKICKLDERDKEALEAAIQALSQEPCERFEWGIDGNVYKITKAKDGKEICQQVCNDAISRDAVIAWFCNQRCGCGCVDRKSCPILVGIRELPSVTQKSGKWIPVNEGLPEERENPITMDYYQYPVTFQNGDVTDIRYYKFGDEHWWHGSQMMDEYVTAWMPLPKPYEPQESEE